MARVNFRILGPLEAQANGTRLQLGGPKQRALLAMLLLDANEVVSRDRLIDGLWGESPPPTASHSLDAYVSRLRKALGDGRLVTRAPGYVLHIGPDELDLARFARLAADGAQALDAEDPELAVAKLGEAESLWRGRPLADLEYQSFAQAHVDRLEELRLQAIEQRMDAELTLGRHDGLIADLDALVAGHPLRERLRGQLMLALARRLAEAGAVAGDPFELDLTMATAGVAEQDALGAIDELAARDLVRPAAVPRRFHFRHPLVRHAVYESCTPGTRLAAHEYCANALAARGAPAAMRAHHVEHAARHGDLGAVAVLREAGENAAQRAPANAARWFDLALGLLPEAAPRGDRVALLMALAETEAATGRFEDSRAALLDSLALTAEDEQELRLKLIGMCASLEQLLGHHEEAHSRLDTALAGLPDSSSPVAVALMIQLAVGSLYRTDFDGMRGWGERALGVAQSLGDLPLTAASTAVLAVADTYTGHVQEAQAHSAEAAALVDSLPDGELGRRVDALANLCTAELYLHCYGEAAAHAKRGLAIGRATGQGDIAPVLVPVLANVLHMWGRIAESAEVLDEAVDAARLAGNVEALAWNLPSRAFTAVAAGDIDLALATGHESVDLTRNLDDSLVSTHAGVALAHAQYESGEPRRAVEVLLMAAGGEELPLIPDGWRANYFLDPGGTATGNVTFYPKVNSLVANAKAYEKLDDGQREILEKAAVQTRDWAIQSTPEDAQAAQTFCNQGGIVVRASEADIAALEEAAAPLYAELGRDEETGSLVAAIRELKQQAPATAAPAACGDKPETAGGRKTKALDGEYRFEITDRQLRDAGITDPSDIAENHGVYMVTLSDGECCWEQKAPNPLDNPDECSTYELDGDRMIWRFPVGRPEVYGWRKTPTGDLELTVVRSAPEELPYAEVWTANTWKRIGDAQ